MSRHVVHLAMSALAGAPSRLVSSLNRYSDYSAVLLRKGQVSTARQLQEPNAISFGHAEGATWDLCMDHMRAASIIHIHNQLSIEGVRLLTACAADVPIVFHVHSPLTERPLFFDHSEFLDFEPAIRFVVPHFHPRAYWDHVAIPNIVSPPESSLHSLPESTPTLMFTPSHRGGGRWNAKSSESTERSLEVLDASSEIRLIVVEDRPPLELLERRATASMSLDEIVTGSYHQVSIEALACGSVAINNADDHALAALRLAYRTGELPPFLRTNGTDLSSRVLQLARDPEGLIARRAASRDYFVSYMSPSRVTSFYVEEYDRL